MTTAPWNHVGAPNADRSDSGHNPEEMSSDFISVVIPTYKFCDSMTLLTQVLEAVLNSRGQDFESIVVDDGSPDKTWETLRTLKHTHPRLRMARLARNSGQHNATLCGFGLARGSFIVTMDDDLQNPPEELPKLIAAIQAGYDLPIGAYDCKHHRADRNFGGRLIDALRRRFSALPPGFQLSSFRAARRVVVANVLAMEGVFPYVTAMLLSHTSRVVNVSIRHEPRRPGRSNYNLRRSILLAFNLLLSYSRYPLYLIAALCAIAITFSVGVSFWMRWNKIAGSTLPSWTSTVMEISIVNGAILLALVVHTLYLSRITQQITRSRVAFTIGELYE